MNLKLNFKSNKVKKNLSINWDKVAIRELKRFEKIYRLKKNSLWINEKNESIKRVRISVKDGE